MYRVKASAFRFPPILKLPFTTMCAGNTTTWSSFCSYWTKDVGRRRSRRVAAPSTDPSIRHTNLRIRSLGIDGKVGEARTLFDEMPQRDAFSFSSMINAYLKNGNLSKAKEVFGMMRERSIFAESAMIDGYAKAGRMDEALEVFNGMEERNEYSWTSMINGYFSSGRVEKARAIFDAMSCKNVVSWTTVMVGYSHNGLIDKAREVFNMMPEKNVVAWTAMVKSYIQNDCLDDAMELFGDMPFKNIRSWNIMISGLLDAHRVSEAIRTFDTMEERNVISWTTIVAGLAKNGLTKLSRKYFDMMPEKDIAAWNAIITAYVDDGLMLEAGELFSLMPAKDVVTWNAMINGYARYGTSGDALSSLICMIRSGLRPNETTITSALTSCRAILEVSQAHALLMHVGFGNDVVVSNALITRYTRSGDLRSAVIIFEDLSARDVVSWSSMISSYTEHGYGHNALHVFARMIKAGSKPDKITLIGVLSACSHAGLVEKGRRIFKSMVRLHEIKPRAEHYCCLIDLLGRAGLVEDAVGVFCKMPQDEVDDAVIGSLLGACRQHGFDEIANYLGEKLRDMDPTTAGSYLLLANVHAASGKWNDLAEVRKRVKERNLRRVPGLSQIEVKGNRHVFCSGERSHPEAEEIYECLENLVLVMLATKRELEAICNGGMDDDDGLGV